MDDDVRLSEIPLAETVEMLSLDLAPREVEAFLERGLLPGCRICPLRTSPSGDPVIVVDGTVLALRRETARCICVRRLSAAEESSET